MPNGVERILTTHTGSLPRPADLLAMIQAKETGQPFDAEELAAAVRRSVAEAVEAQANAGIDIVNDGEFSKPGFSDYIKDRVSGLGGVDPSPQAPTEVDFPEFAEWWRGVGFLGSVAFPRPVCVGPMAWTHPETVETDLANFRDALAGVDVAGAFMTASSPGILDLRIANQHYASEEEYVYALAEMMKVEYRAIADAGFVLQVDAPEMAMGRNWARFRDGSLGDFRRVMGLWAEALNYALAGHPGGAGALPHLLGQLGGAARSRCAAAGHRGHCAAGARGRVLRRGVQSAPRARVAGVAGREAAGGQDAHSRSHRLHDELCRAPGAGARQDPELYERRRARQCHGKHGLRVRHLCGPVARPSHRRVGKAAGNGGGREAGESGTLGLG